MENINWLYFELKLKWSILFCTKDFVPYHSILISLIFTKVSCFEPTHDLSGETKPNVKYLKKLIEYNWHYKYPFS